jgi:hypothetical protein
MQLLCDGAHQVVSTVTQIEDVPVYAHSANYKAKIAPIEIFIRLSAHKVKDVDTLTSDLKQAFVTWKEVTTFSHPINMTLIPMHWKIEIAI